MMKKRLNVFLILISVLLVSNKVKAQFVIQIDFDNEYANQVEHISIDSTDTNNFWQIGVPSKTNFNAAYSPTHAIMTDTLNPYPINDTSVFYIEQSRDFNAGGPDGLILSFYFKFNSDTITDYGTIEASLDSGNTWINLLTEDDYYDLFWGSEKPVLSGNTDGWQFFWLDLVNLTYQVTAYPLVIYRFTFISDSIQTNKDGWIIDDFELDDMYEGINTIKNGNINIYPNPTKGTIRIKSNKTIEQIEVLDINGRVVKQIAINKQIATSQAPRNDVQTIDLSNEAKGIYFVKLIGESGVTTQKIVLE